MRWRHTNGLVQLITLKHRFFRDGMVCVGAGHMVIHNRDIQMLTVSLSNLANPFLVIMSWVKNLPS